MVVDTEMKGVEDLNWTCWEAYRSYVIFSVKQRWNSKLTGFSIILSSSNIPHPSIPHLRFTVPGKISEEAEDGRLRPTEGEGFGQCQFYLEPEFRASNPSGTCSFQPPCDSLTTCVSELPCSIQTVLAEGLR